MDRRKYWLRISSSRVFTVVLFVGAVTVLMAMFDTGEWAGYNMVRGDTATADKDQEEEEEGPSAMIGNFNEDAGSRQRNLSAMRGTEVAETTKASSINPAAQNLVRFVDRLMHDNASPTILQQYNIIKSELVLWNPEASQWARNASRNYKQEVTNETKLEEGKVEVVSVSSHVEECGCDRTVSRRMDSPPLDDLWNQTTCSRSSVFRGIGQKVRADS